MLFIQPALSHEVCSSLWRPAGIAAEYASPCSHLLAPNTSPDTVEAAVCVSIVQGYEENMILRT